MYISYLSPARGNATFGPVLSGLATCSKLNELSGKDITACGISFLCYFDGKAKESDEGKCTLSYASDKRSRCLG